MNPQTIANALMDAPWHPEAGALQDRFACRTQKWFKEDQGAMKEMRIPLERIDIDALFNKTIDFSREQVSSRVDPTYVMVWIESPGDVPVFGPESAWDALSGLKKEGKTVFFPFAYADKNGTLTSANENSYEPTSDDEDSEWGMLIGMDNRVGFLVQVKDGEVIINSAIHASGACPSPAPRVDLYPDCGVLEEPMEKFVRGFIKG